MNLMSISLLYALPTGLALLIPGIVALFWVRKLAARRDEIKACIEQYHLDRFYVPTIPNGDPAPHQNSAAAAIDTYFESRFSWIDYFWPSLIFLFIVAVGFYCFTVWFTQLQRPENLTFREVLHLASPIGPAFLGAYLFCLLESTHRFNRFDLLPSTVLNLTFNLVAGTILGIVLTPIFSDTFLPTMTAAIGLSVPVGLEALKQKIADNLGVRRPVHDSDLNKLFPNNPKVVTRLEDEGIETIADLTQSDPLKLYLILPYELLIILGWIDRAYLLSYFPNKADMLRDKFQIRGIIEMVSISVFFDEKEDAHDNLVSKQQAGYLVDQLAHELETSSEALRNSFDTLITDPQISKIWEMYGAIYERQGD